MDVELNFLKEEFFINRKKISVSVTILLLMVAVVALATGCTETGENNVSSDVAIVNGQAISGDEFQQQVDQIIEMQMQQGMDVSADPDILAEIENHVLDQLISKTLLLQDAESKNIQVSQDDVDEEIELIKGQFNSEEEFQDALELNDLTLESLGDLIREEFLIENLAEQILADVSLSEEIDITEEDIEAFYEQQMVMFEMQGAEAPPLEELRADIEASIKHQKEQQIQQQAFNDYLSNLKEEGDIEILI